jgi:hypothetical protein
MAADDPEEGLEAELSATEEKPADTMQCPVCRETIKAGARKCVECNSDLDWKRYFTLSNTTLALLTALVSVIATSYPAIKRLMTPEKSVISVHVVGNNADDTTMSLLVSNAGRQTGSLNTIVLAYSGKEGLVWKLPLQLRGDGVLFVEPLKTVGITVDLKEIDFHKSDLPYRRLPDELAASRLAKSRVANHDFGGGKCELYVGVVDSNGLDYRNTIEIDCEFVFDYLQRISSEVEDFKHRAFDKPDAPKPQKPPGSANP